ncbi:MAG: bifunctional 3,4-dihydroxy-2-butanone-4-phosphate synthase/GTP cyclohydrolase II [Brevinemataceae bacterium]
MNFQTIEQAIEDIKNGKIIVVIDNPKRENEGDLLAAAETITPEAINFMATHGRGLICMPSEKNRLRELNLNLMTANNTDQHQTAFTISIDYISTTTGISAYERALTIQKFCDTSSLSTDFKQPGHIFPLEAKDGGVLERPGHTEAAVDLAKLAGLKPAGVICEIMSDDGHMMRTESLIEFAAKHNLSIITIEDLIKYRQKHEIQMIKAATAHLPTKYGSFVLHTYVNQITGEHHIALVKGELKPNQPILMRIHSECLTGDVFGSEKCDCGEQLEFALKEIEKNQSGVLLYMRQEGRGIGLVNKIKAYMLQEQGFDTVDANLKLGLPIDNREYYSAAQMLKDLGVNKVDIMTNNIEKVNGLTEFGIEINQRIPIQFEPNKNNILYMKTKKERLHHLLQNIKD